MPEDESILLRRMDVVVDTGPGEPQSHRKNGQPDEPAHRDVAGSVHDKVAVKSVAVQRQVSPRTTETKAPEHQWNDRSGGDADKDVQGEAITTYCWLERKTTVSIYLEPDGLDDVADDAFKVESGKTNVSLAIASVAGKRRISKLTGLAHEITGVKVAQKKGKQTVSLKLVKREEKTWHKLFDDASTKEAVADDTARSNTDITSRVSQTTLSDFSKNLEEPSPAENELTIRHAAWILTRYDVRRSTEW